MQKNYDALVKLAFFALEAWRLAVEYRDQATTLGAPPDIGKKPPHVDEA